MEPVSQLLSPHGFPKPFRRILVAVDPSGASLNAIPYTAHFCSPDTQVLVLGFFEDPEAYLTPHSRTPADVSAAFDELRRDELVALEGAQAVLQRTGAQVHKRLLGPALGNREISAGIARVAEEWQADLVVVGAEPAAGIATLLATKVSAALAEQTHRAILMIPKQATESSLHHARRILFAVDGSEASLHAVRVGMQVAPPHASLLAVYVEDRGVDVSELKASLLSGAPEVLQAASALRQATTIMTELSAKGEIESRVSHTRLTEDVAAALLRESQEWDADLVVVGAQDRHGLFSWFNGHENERVARVIDRPLLVVNQAG
ncbi:Stress response protein NhaX [Pandoraea eparura]|jgi:nucleotide-binding universal stress UspA family protein|uniref:Stress response protein NhaX n=1 Tax=Pandoraea eparura TaxID=2508291 RepID=A0A5E4XIB2_9BURK|nr:universal stress protein [Pandoraea eparura]VVE36104.1 Stress response protein NhaX [Pandoraea eparura]